MGSSGTHAIVYDYLQTVSNIIPRPQSAPRTPPPRAHRTAALAAHAPITWCDLHPMHMHHTAACNHLELLCIATRTHLPGAVLAAPHLLLHGWQLHWMPNLQAHTLIPHQGFMCFCASTEQASFERWALVGHLPACITNCTQ